MTRDFDAAAAALRARRRQLRKTARDMRARLSPPQLAEDALGLIDPELALLNDFKERIQHNRLLSLAILAGVGWLVGAPRHHDGEPLAAENAGTTPPRANIKEKKNDSGQIHGDHRSGAGTGRQEEWLPQELPEKDVLARRGRKARQERSRAPHQRQPQQQPAGKRVEVAEQQPDAERQQQLRQPQP
jgi:hypothetical protein